MEGIICKTILTSWCLIFGRQKKKKTFCDPSNCHWLPALFTQISICLPTDMLSSPFSGLRQKSQKCPEASCLPLQQLEPASLGFNGMTHPLRSLFYSSCSTPSNCGEVRDGSSHSLITAVLSFLPQSRKTPRKTPNCEARMIGNTLSPRLKARKLL